MGRDLILFFGFGISIGGFVVVGFVVELNFFFDSSVGFVVVFFVFEYWGEIISIK